VRRRGRNWKRNWHRNRHGNWGRDRNRDRNDHVDRDRNGRRIEHGRHHELGDYRHVDRRADVHDVGRLIAR
jgi:hypothetical protein